MDSIEGAVTQLDSRLLDLRQDLSRVGDKLQALQDEVPGAHQAEAEVRDDLRSLQFTLARMKQYISEVSVSYLCSSQQVYISLTQVLRNIILSQFWEPTTDTFPHYNFLASNLLQQ